MRSLYLAERGRYRKILSAGLYLSCCGIKNGTKMTREEIIEKLKAMEPELRARGITRMRMFGSRARGDNREDSDLDLLIDTDPDARFSLIDLSGVHLDLTDALGIETQISQNWEGMKPRFRREISSDLVTVFE